MLHHRDDDEHVHAHARVGALGAAALSVHSFLDGLAIGFAFHVSNATGFIVFLAVVSHDFADGLNTVSFVLRQSGDRRAALRWLALDATTPLLGAIVGSARLDRRHRAWASMLSLYAGFFLSMGATDLLPEAHAHPSWRRIGLTVLGVAGTGGIVYLAGKRLAYGFAELRAGEGAEALAHRVVRAERLVVARTSGRRRSPRPPRAPRRRAPRDASGP